MKLKSKTTATLLIALFMISTIAVAVNASPGIKLVFNPDGSANWTDEQVYSGDFSVKLDTGESGAGRGSVKISIEPVLVSALTDDPSYWVFEPTVVSGGQYPTGSDHHPWGHPYMNLVLDLDGDLNTVDPDWLEGIGSSVGPAVGGEAVDPAAGVWTEMTVGWGYYDGYTPDSIVGGGFSVYDPETGFGVHTLAEWQAAMATARPNAKVVEVQICYGLWPAEIGLLCSPVYVDDMTINNKVYPLEDLVTNPVNNVPLSQTVSSLTTSFTVYEDAVTFPEVKPGLTTTGMIRIKNTGDYDITFTAELMDELPLDFYTDNLKMDSEFVDNWELIDLEPSLDWTQVDLSLSVPYPCPAGEKIATLVFWAEATGYTP